MVVLDRLGEDGQGALATMRTQEARCGVGVVASNDGRVQHLFEGVAARLAGLELDDVEDLVGVGDEQIVEGEQYAGPLDDGHAGPLLLRLAGGATRRLHVVGRGAWHDR